MPGLTIALSPAALRTSAARRRSVAAPLAAVALTRNPQAGMSLERDLSARELASGDRLDVTVSVRGKFPRGRSLLLEDDAPPALGGPHRFALNGMSGQGISRSHYRLWVGARGIHRLGPMRICM